MNYLDQANSFCRRLWRDESGVVLALTVVVFLTLFVIACSVYAVGENIRQRIELQNAADAAAYSAGVVQADALSRIAAINKAMAWTYYQLVNMEMDYIQEQWMKAVVDKWNTDYNVVAPTLSRNCSSKQCGSRVEDYKMINSSGSLWYSLTEPNPMWDIGFFNNYYQNGAQRVLNGSVNISNFKKAIQSMNQHEAGIVTGLKGKVADVVWKIVQANVCNDTGDTVRWRYSSDMNNIFDPVTNWQPLTPNGNKEMDLLASINIPASDRNWPGAGSTQWFTLKDGRIYRDYDSDNLVASWNIIYYCLVGKYCIPKQRVLSDSVTGRNYYDQTGDAMPYRLNSNYFGQSGGIVVGIARELTNPFLGIFGAQGIFSFFNPNPTGMMWALAAARAGYKDGDNMEAAYNPFRTSTVPRNGDGSDWLLQADRNLADVDWDAVLVPIAKVWGQGHGADKVVEEFYRASDWRKLDGTITDNRLFNGTAPNWSGLVLH